MILNYINDIGEAIALDLKVEDNSYRNRVIKGEHCLTLHYSIDEHLELPLGTWCEFEGVIYALYDDVNFKKKNTCNFEYTVILETYEALLRKWKVRNKVDKRLKFELTAKPREHVQMIVDNLNMRESGWSIGTCIDAVEKCIAYNHIFCSDALTQQAEAFDTEYEILGKVVNFGKVKYNFDNPLPLSYGNGLEPDVGRVNVEDGRPIEIMHVQGGEKNIDFSTYGNRELLLPKNQQYTYEGNLYKVDELGLSVMRADKPLKTCEEESIDLSHIHPKREGVVGEVIVVDADNSFYDIIDSTIPDSLNYEDYIIKGEKMTLICQTGMLAGKEFEVKYRHNAVNGKKARRFEIVPQDFDGITMPKGVFVPKVGDKYAVFKCMLPAAYFADNATQTGAEWEMFKEAVKQLYELEGNRFTVSGKLDKIWANKDWLNRGGKIVLGGYVNFSDPQFLPEGEKIRITAIKDYINNPRKPEITLSNSPISSSVSSEFDKIKNEEVIVEEQHRQAIQYTKRRFRDSIETMEMIEKAMLDKFSASISPITIHTMQMLAGDESLQFTYYNASGTSLEVTYNNSNKILTAPAGIIKHHTLGIVTISDSHKESEYKKWEVSEFISPPLSEKSKAYYLYVKVSTTTNTGVFRLSETAIKMNDESGYYHLWVGLVGSEYDGIRSYRSMYGYTEILPGRITVEEIISADGKVYFRLKDGEIGGNITFVSGGKKKTVTQLEIDAKDDATEKANAAKDSAATDATKKADAAEKAAKDEANKKIKALDYLIDAFGKETTEVIGGLLLTAFLGVKNSEGKIVSGLNGSNEDLPLLAVGGDGDYSNAAEFINSINNAVFRILQNGQLVAKDAIIQGVIEAVSGKIGGLNIDKQGLYYGLLDEWGKLNSIHTVSMIKPGEVKLQSAESYSGMLVSQIVVGIGKKSDPADKENNITAGYFYRKMNNTSKMYAPAVKIISENVINRNVALYTKGAIVCEGGLVDSGNVMNAESVTIIDLSFGTTITVISDVYRRIYLPNLANVREQTGIIGDFSIIVRVIAYRANSQNIVLSILNDKHELNYFYDQDGNNYREREMGKGDSWMIALTAVGTDYYGQMVNDFY